MFKFEDICKLYGTYSASFVDNGIDRLKQPKKKLRRKFITRNIYETIKRNGKRYHQDSIIFYQKIIFAKIIFVAHNQMQ